MFFKRKKICSCGSVKKFKDCCPDADKNPPSSTIQGQACSLVDEGNALLSKSQHEKALDLYKEALSIYPDYARAHYNSGLVYGILGKLEEAATSYRKAIEIEPNDAEAHNNLAIILRKQGLQEEALTFYRKTLALNPKDAKAHNNLGVLLRELGKIEEAAASYEKAIAIWPEYTESHNNLGVIFFTQGKIEAAVSSFKQALEFDANFAQARIYMAIISWIAGMIESCEFNLSQISPNTNSINKEDVNFVVPYHQYLTKLVAYRKTNPGLYEHNDTPPKLYLLGDSHSLSSANLKIKYDNSEYLTETKIVIGCKAWHLANQEINQYKYGFEKRLESIPNGSKAILIYGEIDCRPNEGIVNHYKKYGNDLIQSITDLIYNYTKYVLEKTVVKNIFPIFCNVPARIYDYSLSIDNNDLELHQEILDIFNRVLKERVNSLKIPLIDVYSITKEESAKTHRKYHIDRNHLQPYVLKDLLEKKII